MRISDWSSDVCSSDLIEPSDDSVLPLACQAAQNLVIMPPLLFAVRQRRNFDQILPIKTDRRLTRHDCGTERAEPGALDARVGDHSLAALRVTARQTHLLPEPSPRGGHATAQGG